MTSVNHHAASFARAMAEHHAGLTVSAHMGAYITGSDAAVCGIDTCPFDATTVPGLVAQWERGRSETLAFQAGRRRSCFVHRLHSEDL